MKRQGRKSKAQTPAPKSERIKGSSKNPTGTAASKKSAESIKFSPAIISVLEKKKDEYNKKHKSKVTLSTLKAVFRRGSGAYSSSHRPTITGGMPNSRSAWAYARVNAFLRKKGGGYAKKSYVQDDDLFEKGGQLDDLINQGIVELKMFNTTPEHAKEYGFNSKNPLYLQSIYISEDYRLKGIGSQVFEHIIEYAEKNKHDLIFGHITQKAEPNIDVIKKMLNDNGFNTIDGNNDFYKIMDTKYSYGGRLKPTEIKILTSEDLNDINKPIMNTTDTYAKGGEVKHNQGAAGGYLVGNRHSEGGIKALNKSTGQPLEMEGGEVVITRNAVNDNTKREFNGKMMTNKEILSAINVSGGGVSFADGGKVSECTCSGRRYKFGGRLMKDYEVIEEIRNQYPADFKKGVGEEMSEHEETFKLLVKRKLTPKQAAERVVAEHLQKKPDYYDNYAEGGTIDIMGRKIVDYQSFQKGGIPVKSPYVGESDEYFKVYHPTKKTHVYAKGGNIRRAVISPLLAYKNFLHMVYDINFSELPNTLKNALLQGKQNLVDKYIA